MRKLTRTLRFSNVPRVTPLGYQRISLWWSWPGADTNILAKNSPVWEQSQEPSPYAWRIGWRKGVRCSQVWQREPGPLWGVSLSQHPNHSRSLKMSYLTPGNGMGCHMRISERLITGDIQVETMDMRFTYRWSRRRNSFVAKNMGCRINWMGSKSQLHIYTVHPNTHPLTHIHSRPATPAVLNPCLLFTLLKS